MQIKAKLAEEVISLQEKLQVTKSCGNYLDVELRKANLDYFNSHDKSLRPIRHLNYIKCV